jgi:hypothetical protein
MKERGLAIVRGPSSRLEWVRCETAAACSSDYVIA